MPRSSVRDVVSSGLASTGFLRLAELLPARPQLIVLNYHRIGQRHASEYDQGVFSADLDGLALQIRAVRKRFTIIRPSDAIDIVQGAYRPREPLALITFDDGYRDNFTNAYPVLRSNDVSAIFFVVTSFVDSMAIPWWDRLALLARRCAAREASMTIPGLEWPEIRLTPKVISSTIPALLREYKRASPDLQQRLIEALEQAAGPEPFANTARLMLDWNEIRTLNDAGMAIGVHSHSHPILARMSPEDQFRELLTSKAIIEQQLGKPTDFVAYPDGGPGTFDEASKSAAARAGFRAAFSFGGGTNIFGQIDPFDVRRCAFSPYVRGSRLRLCVDMVSMGITRWL